MLVPPVKCASHHSIHAHEYKSHTGSPVCDELSTSGGVWSFHGSYFSSNCCVVYWQHVWQSCTGKSASNEPLTDEQRAAYQKQGNTVVAQYNRLVVQYHSQHSGMVSCSSLCMLAKQMLLSPFPPTPIVCARCDLYGGTRVAREVGGVCMTWVSMTIG